MDNEPGGWEQAFVYLAKPSPDGPIKGPCMRRKAPDGSYQYRKMTPAEELEAARDEAW